ncbi:MAG: undecaprenyl-phosphate glucose phosphotransferase [Bacteroidia bacterium]|nr:MAG: undecaprenyl-phosphate glucose phosphotransferase [Bacteroidia bacterium]
MHKRIDRIVLLSLDFLTVNFAFVLSSLMWSLRSAEPPEDFWVSMAINYGYWLLWFFLFGLYRHWYAQSRLDEVLTIFRATALGSLLLFFLEFLSGRPESGPTHRWIVVYWALVFVFVSAGRLVVRALQKRLLEAGIGAKNTLIVGWSQKAFDLCDMVLKYPALGYRVVGFVAPQNAKKRKRGYRGIPVVGSTQELPDLLDRHRATEVLVGLDSTDHDQLLEIIRFCNGREVGMKIIPDLYDIVSGQARINSIYGFPLIEVTPWFLKPWEEAMKRMTDVVVSLVVLIVGSPLWALVALAIVLDSPGPVFYRQVRVGRNGEKFTMLKFRSMREDAESLSGPKWAERNDPRVTRVGKILRRLHLDEVPQFLNVLVGHMSLVGPRPERAYFVEKLERDLPLYRRRLRVRPGMTGWAQIKYRYDQSVEDVRTKLKYDLFYIENMSWRMDLKILFNTLYVLMRGKGHV